MTGIHQSALAAKALPPSQFSFVTSAARTVSLSSETFTAVSLGTAHADRKILIAVSTEGGASGTPPTTVTIGGISATQLTSNGTSSEFVAFWIATVPTGITGDIILTWSGITPRDVAFGLYRLVYFMSTLSDSAVLDVTSNITETINIDCPASGAIIAALTDDSDTAATWTTMTELYDARSGNLLYSGCGQTYSTEQINFAVSVGTTGAGSSHRIISAISLARGR